ncbi:MAG TPA: hypothetical protein VE244_02480 [Nitrososphaeraceae archaeon]|nr:hypothetical protein [Nitrososphaeraceae archaeon]
MINETYRKPMIIILEEAKNVRIQVGTSTKIWKTKDDKVYTITKYIAEEEDFKINLQVAQRMIRSFEIIE